METDRSDRASHSRSGTRRVRGVVACRALAASTVILGLGVAAVGVLGTSATGDRVLGGCGAYPEVCKPRGAKLLVLLANVFGLRPETDNDPRIGSPLSRGALYRSMVLLFVNGKPDYTHTWAFC